MTTAALVAAIISLAISWFSITKVITKQGWARSIWSIVGLFFFISWLGNSFFYFGMVGWIASIILTVTFGVMYGKDRKDKIRN